MVYEKANTSRIEPKENNYSSALRQMAPTSSNASSALEKIASSYTKMPDVRSGIYNIDNCNCGNCGCLQGNLLLVLSPVGIAGSASAFGPFSAM